MYCTNCGEKMNDNQAICLKCGVETGKGKGFCANCGSALNENQAVCLSCGVAVKAAKPAGAAAADAPDYLNGKDKMTIALVCFFLGGFGIHNFMMGESKKGVIKIVLSLLCGIGGILALIDFIKILTGSYKYDPNASF